MSHQAYVLLSFKKEEEDGARYRLKKLLPEAILEEKEEGIYLLSLNHGQKDLAIYGASFRAFALDMDDIHSLAIPTDDYGRYQGFLAQLKDGEHRLLHECLNEKNHEELFAPLAELDPELLLTILVYLENGNSPALASIGLYVHRNTVNYRVEHFEKQTGYDLSLCPTSLFVYLLLKKEERNIRAQLLF